MRTALLLYACSVCCALLVPMHAVTCHAADPVPEGVSSRDVRIAATRTIPFNRLSPQASELVKDVVEHPSYYRRMPQQQIDCHPEMFTFLVRRPEVMVNIWELMGITQVSARRTSPLAFLANDGVGTTAKCELIYGDERLHVYYGTGNYDGNMSPRKITGRCVCILQSQTATNERGENTIAGTMDVFLKLDNLGADLLTRTLGPLVSKTADYNFVESAKFISQISQVCTNNPAAAQGLASQLTSVDGAVRQEFATIAANIAAEQNTAGSYGSLGATESPANQSTSLAQRPIVPTRTAISPELALDASDDAPLALAPSASSNSEQIRKVLPQPILAEGPTAIQDTPSTIAPRKNQLFMRR